MCVCSHMQGPAVVIAVVARPAAVGMLVVAD